MTKPNRVQEQADSVRPLWAAPGHTHGIKQLAWTPDGSMLASASNDGTVRLWNAESPECIRTLRGHKGAVNTVSFRPGHPTLASAGDDGIVKLWNVSDGHLMASLTAGENGVLGVSWSADGRLASASLDGSIRLWHSESRNVVKTIEIQREPQQTGIAGEPEDKHRVMLDVAWSPDGRRLASASWNAWIWDESTGRALYQLLPRSGFYRVAWSPDSGSRWLASGSSELEVVVWDSNNGRQTATLQGHTGPVTDVEFSPDGVLLASADSSTVRLWRYADDSWKLASAIHAAAHVVAFHPVQRTFATSSSRTNEVQTWSLDQVLANQRVSAAISYTSAKIVLVGDSGVGKTGLGWRLAHRKFKEQASTHGQQFWVLDQLGTTRPDGTQCEAILWDLAGQPDYRLIHALFLDDADLALILFDPSRTEDPLRGVEFWLKQLRVAPPPTPATFDGFAEQTHERVYCPAILVAARSDRGTPRLTIGELQAFCRQRGLRCYLSTSALKGDGIEELIGHMRGSIDWEEKPPTVTTETFKRVKDYVLKLKEGGRATKVILTPAELRRLLESHASRWIFTDQEMFTAVTHLANHGYVTKLITSRGEPRLLLAPELLNNLAASFILEARSNRRGLGSLEEQSLLAGKYSFAELEGLSPSEREVILDSAVVLFLQHNICFRETDPLNSRTYLIFPELINLKKPAIADDLALADGPSYMATGAVENVYSSLVVLLGYTQTFTRTNQWQNHARYEVGDGLVCGFRLEAERGGELDFVLYFGANVGAPIRRLFQSLFESFLARHDLAVNRYEPVLCAKNHQLNREIVREQTSEGFAFCAKCGEKVFIPRFDQPLQLTSGQAADANAQRLAAERRSRFEQAIFRLKTFIVEQKTSAPECFISYAWGDESHERWVERSLATDLAKAGVVVVLDKWENSRVGASVPRFIERVGKCDKVIVVGTGPYRSKYENKDPMRGFVAAAEGDLIGNRMIGTEAKKETVLPILLEGTVESSLPEILQGRVYADFRDNELYFETAFDLLLSLYEVSPQQSVAAELRDSLREKRLGESRGGGEPL